MCDVDRKDLEPIVPPLMQQCAACGGWTVPTPTGKCYRCAGLVQRDPCDDCWQLADGCIGCKHATGRRKP